MAVRVPFLPVDAEVLHEWEILNGKENGRLPAEVGVLVPKVGRHDEEVASAPLIDLPGNNASALPFEDVVDGGAGLSMRKRFDSRSNHLNAACEGRVHRPRSSWVNVLHHDVVVRVRFSGSRQTLQCGCGICPTVVDKARSA